MNQLPSISVLTSTGSLSAAIRVSEGDAPTVVLVISDMRDEKTKAASLDFQAFEDFALGITAIYQKIRATAGA